MWTIRFYKPYYHVEYGAGEQVWHSRKQPIAYIWGMWGFIDFKTGEPTYVPIQNTVVTCDDKEETLI